MFLKLNLDFIVAEIRGVFGSVGVYACVCESKSWPLLLFGAAKAQLWMISEAILIPKIYARLQEIASNFSKFSRGGTLIPRRRSSLWRSVRGFAPLPSPPFQNSEPLCLIGSAAYDPTIRQPSFDLPRQQRSLLNHFWTARVTMVPIIRNGTRQPLICVLIVKSKRCPTLSTPVLCRS